MAIVDLDKVTSRQPRRSDRALIMGLGGAILVFGAAIWLSAPHPTTTSPQSSAAVAGGAISRSGIVVMRATPPITFRTLDPSARPPQIAGPADHLRHQ